MKLFTHPEFAGHEQVVFGHDEASGLRAIIAVHNTHRGPALGGLRMWPYADEGEALTDVLRLARGMTYKSAMAELPLGGGKSVIIGDPRRDKSEALMEAMGRLVDGLGGRYIVAEDSGTTVTDMRVIARRTRHVAGRRERPGYDGRPSDGDPSPATAYGVFVGIRAAVAHRLGRSDLEGLRVAVQGVGSVGRRLAAHLAAAGARLWVTDIDPERRGQAAETLGAEAVPPEAVYDLDVDVFAPCALGAVINDATVPRLRAKVVAGAANNQLAAPRHGEALARRGILYAPDYVINAGGVIDVCYEHLGLDPAGLRAHIERIGDNLAEIFRRAEREGRPTAWVADRIAESRFAAGLHRAAGF
ncbi:Glu/Leu/Phe/Val dehydrogenase dimerization domain-containing protein [Inmirania thermothiophila]|uniref:Leucine dehydrogenase n=1 Tax=Inmirania thermothiophila TaxID=1750597 RepID=A0A3N1Y9P3_9GAMM|nr:Glu/Leu/Phe/Val dehydrogenase dimerization domain-containing protein [Inmirania thermothiophila]ROR35208.1 leucine dehydrogenase [Inmirania thermothiophila]